MRISLNYNMNPFTVTSFMTSIITINMTKLLWFISNLDETYVCNIYRVFILTSSSFREKNVFGEPIGR